jgi:RNA polymerase sigma-70 factor (ECF subfamily)
MAAGSPYSTMDDAAAVFLSARPRLFGIAYRMLGSSAEAEDVVQDAWLRWQQTDRSVVVEPAAFLATVTTRLAINVAQSARKQRETYIGPWLPEPVDTRSDPQLGAQRGEALGLAVLLLLEKLSPSERAAYVLREAFEYTHRQIAEILEIGEANARQLVTRARKRMSGARQAAVSVAERRRLLETFIAAAQNGELEGLENLFAADVASYSDGGGVVTAARIPVLGRARVAKFIAAFASHFWTGTSVEWVDANGEIAAMVRRDGEPLVLVSITVAAEGIAEILWVMNPMKLAPMERSLTNTGQR